MLLHASCRQLWSVSDTIAEPTAGASDTEGSTGGATAGETAIDGGATDAATGDGSIPDVLLNPADMVQQATEQECVRGQGICGAVFEATNSRFAGQMVNYVADWFAAISGPLLQAALTILVGMVVVFFVRRYISHVTENIATGKGRIGRAISASARPVDDLIDPTRGERREQRARAVGQLIRNFASILIWTIVAINIVVIFGLYDRFSPLFASAGIAGIALGFGAQSLVRDFLSGIFMILEDQYGVGDIIDVGEATGTVEMVGLRVTRLRDLEGVVWYVRNGELMRVGNHSQGWARAVLDVGIGYHNDVEHAEEVMLEVAEELAADDAWGELILEKPDVWGVENLGDNSVMLRLVVKTKPLEQWKVARELRARIKERFDEEGVEIPFPQQTVWIHDGTKGNDPAQAPTGSSPESGGHEAPTPAAAKNPRKRTTPGRGESEAMKGEAAEFTAELGLDEAATTTRTATSASVSTHATATTPPSSTGSSSTGSS